MRGPYAGIEEIHIRDFRGIESLDLTFRHPSGGPTQIGVVGGPNGSGKTAVLEACLLATGHQRLIVGKSGAEAVRWGARNYDIGLKLRIGEHDHTPHADPRSAGPDLVPLSYFSSWRAPQLVGSLGVTAGKRGKRPAKNEQNRLLNIKQFLVNARAHEFFPRAASQPSSRFAMVADQINQAWNMFFPGQSFVVEPVGDRPEDGFDVFVLHNQARLPIDLLSSGQLEVFMMAGGLAIEDSPRGIILIDEPELHLDPQWHRTVLNALVRLRPESQILVGTHSPEIYDSVMSFERCFLVPETDPRAKGWLSNIAEAVAR